MLGALAMQRLVHVALPQALMTVAPVMLVGWVVSQSLAGATGIPSTVTTWRWNGAYSLVALGLLAVLAWAAVPG